jgi:hypothetical protein
VKNINAIPNSGETFMTFSIGNLKSTDTFQLMTFSLEKLAGSLKVKAGDPFAKFTNMKSFNEKEMPLSARKGPYELIDDHTQLTHKGLPSKKKILRKVKLDGMSDEDYKHVQNVYNTFKCEDLMAHHWLYLKPMCLYSLTLLNTL